SPVTLVVVPIATSVQVTTERLFGVQDRIRRAIGNVGDSDGRWASRARAADDDAVDPIIATRLGWRAPGRVCRRDRRTARIVAPGPRVGDVIDQAPVRQRPDHRLTAARAKKDLDRRLLDQVITVVVAGIISHDAPHVPLLDISKDLIRPAPSLVLSLFGRRALHSVGPGTSHAALCNTVNQAWDRRVTGGAVAIGPPSRREVAV